MRGLTITQKDALEKIHAHRNCYVRRFWAELAKDLPAGASPSEWVNVATMTTAHHVRRRDIMALIKKGFLEERPSGGWGPEVRVIERSLGHAATT